MGNHGTSGNKFSHTESNGHLNELTEEAVTKEVGSLFHNLRPVLRKKAFCDGADQDPTEL